MNLDICVGCLCQIDTVVCYKLADQHMLSYCVNKINGCQLLPIIDGPEKINGEVD